MISFHAPKMENRLYPREIVLFECLLKKIFAPFRIVFCAWDFRTTHLKFLPQTQNFSRRRIPIREDQILEISSLGDVNQQIRLNFQ